MTSAFLNVSDTEESDRVDNNGRRDVVPKVEA